jgi:polysaccharide lyase-like protein
MSIPAIARVISVWPGSAGCLGIRLHLHRSDPTNPDASIEIGQYPVAILARGTWHDFRLEVKWALANGYVKVWHNGQVVQEVTGIQTLFPTRANSTVAGTAYPKMGLYRKAVALNQTFVLYHDQVRRLASP